MWIKSYMTRVFTGTPCTSSPWLVWTSSPLCGDRWTPECISYTAAQWGCWLGIDLVVPGVLPIPASPRSSWPDAAWKRDGGEDEEEQKVEYMSKLESVMRSMFVNWHTVWLYQRWPAALLYLKGPGRLRPHHSVWLPFWGINTPAWK